MGKHGLTAMFILVAALPCILFGYLIAVKQWRNLIAGWDESKIADPESYAKIVGGSVLGIGIGLVAIAILLWTEMFPSDLIVGSLFFISIIPIPCLVYANIKYKKRSGN